MASSSRIENRDWLSIGRDTMRHRGPDDAGEFWSTDGRVGLGHRRLSILDLSPAGHQPMQDQSRELCIVFNGEIYNFAELRPELTSKGYLFSSDTDTEVILAAYREWGPDCVARLNGMFAFAIYDARRQQVFIARDRAGEKPLYYTLAGKVLRFASELKGLMADRSVPRRINLEALDCYLAMGFVPGERCILEGINKLPPAHALMFELSNASSKLWRYWRVPDLSFACHQTQANEIKLLDKLETLLEDSVRRQLVADVPVGILLSGGVDSSLVTAMAVRSAPNVKTFTIRFPGYGKYDETEHARLIAHHFGVEHMELEATDSTIDLLPKLARQFDEPIVDSSMVPTFLVSSLIRQHCTVALGGDGGDELFGGYHHYSNLLRMRQRLRLIPENMRLAVASAAELMLPVGFKGRNWLQGMNVNFRQGLPMATALFDRTTRRRLMAGHGAWTPTADGIRELRIPQTADLLRRATQMDFENYLPEDILVKVDRTSMLNSLEVRAPMLDYRLIEFAFSDVPAHFKATVDGSKILLKKLTERVLPKNFDRLRKQGFSIPLASWLKSGGWQTFFHEVLLESNGSFFDRRVIYGLLEGQARGRANSERLFALVMFELWRREYEI